MSDKRRFPRADAIAVVRELLVVLNPVVARIIVAGSLRRRKSEVGDVEILFIPKIAPATDPASLFGEMVSTNLVDVTLDALISSGVIEKRVSAAGASSWGAFNKYARHAASEIPVDLFLATPANWFNYLVCRTGGAESNKAIAIAANARGWTWHPYGNGFEKKRLFGRTMETRTIHAEREVFDFVGLPFLQPWERR